MGEHGIVEEILLSSNPILSDSLLGFFAHCNFGCQFDWCEWDESLFGSVAMAYSRFPFRDYFRLRIPSRFQLAFGSAPCCCNGYNYSDADHGHCDENEAQSPVVRVDIFLKTTLID